MNPYSSESTRKEQILREKRKKAKYRRKLRRLRNLRIIRVWIVLMSLCILIFYGGTFLYKTIRHLISASDSIVSTYDTQQTKEVSMASLDMDTDLFNKLNELSKTEPKVTKIMDHIEKYPENVLNLLIKNPETIDFVLDYPNDIDKKKDISLYKDVKKGEIPLFLQWDKRWGYSSYGDNIIGVNGCGPTCLSMVLVYLSGETFYNPKVVANFSEEEGYLDESSSTKWDLMSIGAGKLGIKSTILPLDKNTMIDALNNKHPIICSMGPGDFTTTGHFIVITGYEEGLFTVHDPNSKVRSNKKWNYDNLKNQIKNLWAFSNL